MKRGRWQAGRYTERIALHNLKVCGAQARFALNQLFCELRVLFDEDDARGAARSQFKAQGACAGK